MKTLLLILIIFILVSLICYLSIKNKENFIAGQQYYDFCKIQYDDGTEEQVCPVVSGSVGDKGPQGLRVFKVQEEIRVHQVLTE